VTRIAIIGGGIGGLTTALTLKQAGFDPEVFEQAPELLEVGAAIAVWPNAMRILDRLGLGQEIRRRGGAIEQVRWLDFRGTLINSSRIPKSETPALALQRADLQSSLLRAWTSPAIHLGKVFRNFQKQQQLVRADFADGSTIDCDLLIGCDGLHSHVREQLLETRAPVYRGYTVWRGTTKVAPRQLEPGTAMEFHGSGQRFGVGPVGLNRIGWWASANETLTSAGHSGDHQGLVGSIETSPSDHQDELLTLFAGWYAPILELIAGTPAASIVKTPALDRPATKEWGQGPVTLLGDAVHPTTPNLGQGGCMAIEDAVVLARCLQKYGPRHEALRAYERLRYSRTRVVTGYSRFYGSVGQWQQPAAVRLRGALLSLVPQVVTQRLLRMIFAYDAYAVNV